MPPREHVRSPFTHRLATGAAGSAHPAAEDGVEADPLADLESTVRVGLDDHPCRFMSEVRGMALHDVLAFAAAQRGGLDTHKSLSVATHRKWEFFEKRLAGTHVPQAPHTGRQPIHRHLSS